MPLMLRRTHRRRVAELIDYYEKCLGDERTSVRRLRGRIAELEMQLARRSPRPSAPGDQDGYIHLRTD